MLNNEPKCITIRRCINHLEILGVDPKIRQLVSMYIEMAYQEGVNEKETAYK
ncbi:hypothetical protein [Pseudalkalibacillus berkeleyi]|uniref:Uncharacterized protein n=1 Tax=Pseudalkalibacillus berkeleyi TaxID=1069813 RepID=A0ABS9H0P3_9BACL|nr:hypothetical protein [Pseudalkalibacillus berkeleyi]MCF6137405.1 hypothetical protein [Pseudalkalibacillus berkeleyi]